VIEEALGASAVLPRLPVDCFQDHFDIAEKRANRAYLRQATDTNREKQPCPSLKDQMSRAMNSPESGSYMGYISMKFTGRSTLQCHETRNHLFILHSKF
jgi:hypothetical protein